MPGYTYDTGALIALERRDRRMGSWFNRAKDHRDLITVPAAVLVEWWRAQKDPRLLRALSGMTIEPLTEELAKRAGLALAQMHPQPSVVDAVVMASAAQRGDIVVTSDLDDMQRLREHFKAVPAVLRV